MTGEINKMEKGNSKHDLLLSVLKHDYGYVNDKAVAELERLFRQFQSINKCSRSHTKRLKSNFHQDA